MTATEGTPGRLILVTGPDVARAAGVGRRLAESLANGVHVDARVIDDMVVSGPAAGGGDPATDPELEQVRRWLLRWSAAIALAETFGLEEYDTVISDVVLGRGLEDFLDLAEPTDVHVLVLADREGPDRQTPRWGVWLGDQGSDDVLARAALDRLDTARVKTAESQAP